MQDTDDVIQILTKNFDVAAKHCRISGDVLAEKMPRGVPAGRLFHHPWPWVPLEVK